MLFAVLTIAGHPNEKTNCDMMNLFGRDTTKDFLYDCSILDAVLRQN